MPPPSLGVSPLFHQSRLFFFLPPLTIDRNDFWIDSIWKNFGKSLEAGEGNSCWMDLRKLETSLPRKLALFNVAEYGFLLCCFLTSFTFLSLCFLYTFLISILGARDSRCLFRISWNFRRREFQFIGSYIKSKVTVFHEEEKKKSMKTKIRIELDFQIETRREFERFFKSLV